MASHTCPFCYQIMSISPETKRTYNPSFAFEDSLYLNIPTPKDAIQISFFRCPNCEKTSIYLTGLGKDVKDISLPVYPQSLAKQFPDYVPLQIRQDYEEAYSIASLSPKSSATLSRRCLQGMIADFWGIRENKLAASITKLQDKVPAKQWKAIDAVRSLGNIGAHMEKDINLIIDIDQGEALVLLRLIEVLIEHWYINRHTEEELYSEIAEIAEDKENQRHSR